MLKQLIFKKSFLLLVILLLGLSFRIYGLAKESVWIDEGISIRVASIHNPLKIIKANTADLPLYHTVLHYWIKLFGNSEFSARFLSLIFGLLVIFMAYKIGALIFDVETGLLSAMLVALSSFHIQYSQEARMYSMLAFFTLLSFYYFVKFTREKSLANSTKYALSSIILMFTHFFGVIMVFSQGVYIITLFLLSKKIPRENILRWAKLQLVLCLLFIPLGIYLFIRFRMISGFASWWIPRPSLVSVVASFLEFSGSLPLMLMYLLLSFIAVLNFRRLSGGNKSASFFEAVEESRWSVGIAEVKNIYLLLVWLLVPVIILYLVSVFLFPVYWTRYTIGCSLAFYLLIAKGIRNISGNKAKLAVIILIVFFSITNLMVYYREVHKENWREAAGDIDKRALPGDLLLFSPGTGEIPFNYYSKSKGVRKKGIVMMYETVDEANIGRIDELTGGRNRVWVVTTHNRDPNGILAGYFNKNFDLLYSKKYMRVRFVNIRFDGFINKEDVGIEVFLYNRK